MKLRRTLQRWKGINPETMRNGSVNALVFALQDARSDIMLLAGLLCKAAYPRMGTTEREMDIYAFARLVQTVISHHDAVEGTERID